MPKCNQCNKKGLFLKINTDGICDECVTSNRLNELRKIEEETLSNIDKLNKELNEIKIQKEKYGFDVYEIKKELSYLKDDCKQIKNKRNSYFSKFLEEMKDDEKRFDYLENKMESDEKKLITNTNKLLKSKILLQSLQYSTERYYNYLEFKKEILEEENIKATENFLSTVITLKLPHMDIRELKRRFALNKKIIQEVLIKYKENYTTKTNKNIYNLMVMALEAELQNILYDLSYSKLDKAIDNIKKMTDKYQKLALEGNQSIANTIIKFIGEIEFLYIESVKIEYEYHIQKERIKEEQRTLREQMRQESLERKILEEQKRKIEIEESKFEIEINTIKKLIQENVDRDKIQQLEERLLKIQNQLEDIEKKKEEIYKLQNGKAGYVYIISNLGSFGENMFKVGMTRRLNPQDRVDELGSASVPFKFDVHSFIFSENAPELEYNLHKSLSKKRVNKVNLRKEFFNCTINEIEELVYDLEPTSQFNRTMFAEQYYQSINMDDLPLDLSEIYKDNYFDDEFDEETIGSNMEVVL